jgi:hypothetical protein
LITAVLRGGRGEMSIEDLVAALVWQISWHQRLSSDNTDMGRKEVHYLTSSTVQCSLDASQKANENNDHNRNRVKKEYATQTMHRDAAA